MRIRIQPFRLMRVRIQGFDDKQIVKLYYTSEEKKNFLHQKFAI